MAFADFFSGFRRSKRDPGEYFIAITPNDGTDLVTATRGIIVGVQGNVQITDIGGATTVLPALTAGVVHPVRASRIWATNTTATSIVGVS